MKLGRLLLDLSFQEERLAGIGRFSAADIVLASELYWASQVGLLADAAEAQRYLSTLMKRPAFPRIEPAPM